MIRIDVLLFVLLSALTIATPCAGEAAEQPSAAQVEFFEARIRPVLVEQCYRCHNSAKSAEGGLTDVHGKVIHGVLS
jgi:predicted CXXCH cytochrome family protein